MVMLAACKDDDAASEQRVDPSQLTNSSGEVSLTDGGSLSYVITSERYKLWERAQRGISKRVAARFGQLLNPRSPSEQSIQRAITYLESQPAARASIEGAGMSVRDFVVMTVALEQQMQLAASRGEPSPAYSPNATMDSGYLPAPPGATPYPAYPQPYPYPPPQAQPYPQPYPQFPPTYPPTTPTPVPQPTPVPPTTSVPQPAPRPADTLRVDTLYPKPVPHDAFPKRDTLPRRDTLPARRDTIVPPRPTDTLVVSPPDSLASA